MSLAILRTRPDVRAGLAAQYLLNERNYYDTSGHGLNPTTIQAVTIVPGPKGNWATNFVSANSSYISPGSPASLALTGAVSVSFWLNSTSASGGSQFIAASMTGGSNGAWGVDMGEIGGGGKLGWWQNTSGAVLLSTAKVNDGNWHHVVGTRSGSAGAWTITFYIDGALDSSGSTAQNPTATVQQFAIGRLGSFGGDYFNGSLFDVRVYSRTLSQVEANMLYNSLWAPVELEPSIMQSAGGAKFRRSASALGTRTGSRQVWQ